jgi:uncharacterized SAM-binding protein YcdF (DUF218 family)
VDSQDQLAWPFPVWQNILPVKSVLTPVTEPVGAIWLLLVLCLVGLLWRRRWCSAAWLGLPVALFFLLGGTPIIDRLVEASERPYVVADINTLPAADAVVVLGSESGMSPHDPLGFSLGPAAADRYLTAVLLTRLAKAPVLVLGGDDAFPDRPGQSQMILIQNWIQAWKLTPVTVTNLGICANTHDEALHYRLLAAANKWNHALLVTSALHLKRAEAVFQRQGLAVVPVGCDFHDSGSAYSYCLIPSQDRLVLWSLYLHEKIGWWVYEWRGWI